MLDEQTSALAERMRRARRAPEIIAGVRADIERLRARIPHARETIDRLAARYAREALVHVEGNVAEADQLLGFAEHSVGVAERRRAAGQREQASVALEASVESVRRAATLLDAVETFEVEALRAESTLAALVEESRRDLAAALEEPRSRRVADTIGELQAALAALPPAGVNTDPFAHLSRLREARAALDAAIAAARERATDLIPLVNHVHHAIKDADRQLDVARDAIAGHPGWIGAEALTRLAESERIQDRSRPLPRQLRGDDHGDGPGSPRADDRDGPACRVPRGRSPAPRAARHRRVPIAGSRLSSTPGHTAPHYTSHERYLSTTTPPRGTRAAPGWKYQRATGSSTRSTPVRRAASSLVVWIGSGAVSDIIPSMTDATQPMRIPRRPRRTTDMGEVRTAGVDLDASLGYLLKQAASTLRSSMDAALRPLGLTVPQYACLELLAQRPGLSNSELARGAFVTRQSMNVLLRGLERDGFVSRPAEPPATGRALPVQLTTLGRERLAVASSAARAVEERMLAQLDADQQETLRALLTATVTALNEAPTS